MAVDRREDPGEFYPDGKIISTRPIAGGGDMKHSDFADVAELPDRFNDTMIHDKLNEVIGLLKGPVAAFALTLALDVLLGAFSAQGAGVTVQTAPKGAVFNDEQIVTNVVFDATGLATPEMVTNIVQDVSPAPDFSTNNVELVETIEAKAPTPTWDTLSGKPTFAQVATSGAYSDLSGKPSIPTTAADVGAVSLNGGRMNLGATLSFGPQGDGVDIYSGGIELSDTDDGHTESLFIDYNSITFTKRGESTVYHFPLAASEIGALSNTGGTISNASDASRILVLGKIGLVMAGSAYQRKGQGKLGYIIMLNDGTQREASLFLDDDGKTYINTAGGWVRVPDAPTGGTLALTSDIPTSMAWGSITGKPTTLSGYGITDALKSDFTSLTNNAAFTSAVAAVSPPTDLTHVEAEIETNRTAIATLSARAYIEVVSADEVYYVFTTNQE